MVCRVTIFPHCFLLADTCGERICTAIWPAAPRAQAGILPSKEPSLGVSHHPHRHPPCWEPISSARDSAGCLNALCARLHTPQTFPHCFHRRGPKHRPSPHPRALVGLGPALCHGPSSRSNTTSTIPCECEAVLGILHQAPRAASSLRTPPCFLALWAEGAGMLLARGCWSTPPPRAPWGLRELLCSLVLAAALEGRQAFCKRSVKCLQSPSGCCCPSMCGLPALQPSARSPLSHRE